MNYFSQWPDIEFLRQDESRVKASEALKDKDYVIFFVGAPWDRDYNKFIPTLRAFYDKHHESKRFEVILLTRGDTEEEILSDFYNPEFGTHYSLPCSPAMMTTWRKKEAAAKKKQQLKLEEEKSKEDEDDKTEKKVEPLPYVEETDDKGNGLVRVPRTGQHGNYLLIDPAHSEPVGSPILFFFRVFSYPGVIVVFNRPPVVNPPPVNIWPLPNPRGKYEPAVVRPPFEVDKQGRRKYTPLIKDRRCEFDICTIAGRFLMEKKDPEGLEFPWDKFNQVNGPIVFIIFVLLITVLAGVFAFIMGKNPELRDQVNNFIGYKVFY